MSPSTPPQATIMASGGVELLIGLVASGSDVAKEEAAGTLRNLASDPKHKVIKSRRL